MSKGSLLEEFEAQQITEVSHAELLRSMSLLYEHMPCCAKLIDEHAYLLSMGTVGRELMEVEDFSALRGVCWLDVWRGEYNARAIEAFEQAKREGHAQFEGFAFTAKHTPKWWRVTLLKVELGGKTYFFSLSEDITSERGYDGLDEETSPSKVKPLETGIHHLQVSDQGCVLSVSAKTMDALHATRGELFFERFFAPVYAKLTSQIEADAAHIRFGGVMCRIGNKLRRVSLELKPYFSIEGDRLGWDLEVMSLTQHATLTKEIDVLYRMAPGLIMVVDDEARVMTANPATTRIFGDVTRMSLTKVLDTNSSAEFERSHQRLKRDPSLKDEECWLRFSTSEGEERWFLASLFYVVEEQLCYIYAVDMTKRREVEERLREVNMRLTTTNQHLEALHHISHHNVQEPIRKILIHTDRAQYFLKQEEEEESKELAISSIRTIQKIADEMRTQLYALIAYTNAQRYELDLKVHKLGDLFDAALRRHRERDEASGSDEIVVTCDPQAREIDIVCDEEMTELMFYYLIDNAHKFSLPEQPTCVTLSAERHDRRVSVWLRDEGIGVEPKYLDRIVKPFQKLERDGEGHGMGLAICQKIMQAHQGMLSVESQGPGQGFEVRLDFVKGAS